MTAVMDPQAEAAQEGVNEEAMLGAVDALRKAAVDAVSDTRNIVAEATGLERRPTRYDAVRFVAKTPGGNVPLRILEGAHEQVGEKLGIPKKYYERMLDEAPDLLATNINTWHERQPGKRLVRMLRPNDAEAQTFNQLGVAFAVRAVLSDKYRALDYGSLLNTVMPVAKAHGLSVREWQLTEKNFYVRFKAADESMQQLLGAMFTGIELRPGVNLPEIMAEVLGFGAALRNSETGHGALQLEPMFEVRRCLNRLVVDYYNKVRAVHIGRKLDDSADFYQADTRTLDNAAVFLKVRDNLNAMMSGEAKQKAAQVLLKSMTTTLELPEQVGSFQFIEGVAQTLDLSETEQQILKDEVLAEIQFTGQPLTPFAISQGLTATAKRIGAGNMERKDELEHMGWRVLEDPVEKLIKAAASKAARN